ncbi:MAG: Os1348 family NHLP clan protein [Planctomycetaceae bacterium]|nr:Os1348 family NHLP clan protein [Planctomycetaceae bacterium]
MPEQLNNGAAQFRADVPEGVEQESVRTTIVGGRPPGSGQPIGQIPRGIEILLKKAAVDAEFRDILLADSEQAAASIELVLEPVEAAMLQNIPTEQLAAIIDKTEVPQSHRRTFLGTAAAAMLAVLTGTQTALAGTPSVPQKGGSMGGYGGIRTDIPQEGSMAGGGIRSDMPPVSISFGIQPDVPNNNEGVQVIRNLPAEIRLLIAETTKKPPLKVSSSVRITLSDHEMLAFRKEIYKRFDVRMPIKTLKTLKTVKLLTDYIVESLEGYE